LVVVNPDTEAAPTFVEALVDTLERHPRAGLVTAQVVYFDDRTTINTCGTDVQLSGVSYCRRLGRRTSACTADEEVAAISGCGFAARRSVIRELGGFVEELFLYVEDTDLSLRARLAGYEVWHASGAVLYHKYDVKMTPRKFFYLERNRWLMLLW